MVVDASCQPSYLLYGAFNRTPKCGPFLWSGLPYDMVADSKRKSALSKTREPDRSQISSYILALEVMECHTYHILLVEAVRKIYPGSRGEKRPHLWAEACQCNSVRRAWNGIHVGIAIYGKYNQSQSPTVSFHIFSFTPKKAVLLSRNLSHRLCFFEAAHASFFFFFFFSLLFGCKKKIKPFSLALRMAKFHIKYMKGWACDWKSHV